MEFRQTNSTRPAEYPEEDWLALSGIQHFVYCRRQWALIHVEQQWNDNYFTADGQVDHERVNDPNSTELRNGVLSVRALRVLSARLGVTGICDLVEFRSAHKGEEGAVLKGRPGRWIPYPVEYKRGNGHAELADQMQLCCEALCLEEMLGTDCPEGALYYVATRHRVRVAIDDSLRVQATTLLDQMHDLLRRGFTPRVRQTSQCRSCSLRDICLPELTKRQSVSTYLNQAVKSMEMTEE